jgi:hypothetical protein
MVGFLDLKGRQVRIRTLELMAEKYVTFLKRIKNMFSMDDFGVMTSLKQIIEMKAPDRSKAGQPGIPQIRQITN